MEIKYFENGFVGKAVYDTNEAIKCFNAGMEVRQADGDDFLWKNEDQTDPSDNDIIGRIIKEISCFGNVYVGFELEGKKVVDINTTTLTCDIKEGQTVYLLHSGEIVSGEVECISLSTNKKIEERGRFKFWKATRYGTSDDHQRNSQFQSMMTDIHSMLEKDCVCVNVKSIDNYLYVPLDKVFPTKEALVQDLLSKSK